jgi:hypothetical protein
MVVSSSSQLNVHPKTQISSSGHEFQDIRYLRIMIVMESFTYQFSHESCENPRESQIAQECRLIDVYLRSHSHSCHIRRMSFIIQHCFFDHRQLCSHGISGQIVTIDGRRSLHGMRQEHQFRLPPFASSLRSTHARMRPEPTSRVSLYLC